MFSSSTQGVSDNGCAHNLGDRPNLARQLIDAGYTFARYSKDLPHAG
jgi:phosphatidylinositol-3-phosphatase